MTLLGTLFQIIGSIFLTFIPARVLKKYQMKVTILFCFLTFVSSFVVSGLIIALPISVVLLLYFKWLDFISKNKKNLFTITFIITIIWLILQLIHIPIRFYLGQPNIKITANIAGFFMSLTMFIGCIEFNKMNKNS